MVKLSDLNIVTSRVNRRETLRRLGMAATATVVGGGAVVAIAADAKDKTNVSDAECIGRNCKPKDGKDKTKVQD